MAANLQRHIGLADVIGKIEATILIGLSTVGGAFSESIVREMARKVQRPIIFPLSNPTTKSEAKAEDLIRWTDGTRPGGDRFSFCTGELQRAHDSDRTVQQRLHLPRHGTWSCRVWRFASNRCDDAGSGPSARRKFARTQRLFCVSATSFD